MWLKVAGTISGLICCGFSIYWLDWFALLGFTSASLFAMASIAREYEK